MGEKRKEKGWGSVVCVVIFIVIAIVFFIFKRDIPGTGFLVMALVFLFKDQILEIQIKDFKLKLQKVDHSLKEMRGLATTFTKLMALMKNVPPGFLTYKNADKSLEASCQINEYFPKMEKVLKELDVPSEEIGRLKKEWDGDNE